MISLVRVDNRLIHGQVIEAWLPHLRATRIVVADDVSARDALSRAAMSLAVPPTVEVEVRPLDEVDFAGLSEDDSQTLVLLRDVGDVERARQGGLSATPLNLGNVHFIEGRRRLSPSVFLSQGELDLLKMLSESGFSVEARAVPNERALGLDELKTRFGRESA